MVLGRLAFILITSSNTTERCSDTQETPRPSRFPRRAQLLVQMTSGSTQVFHKDKCKPSVDRQSQRPGLHIKTLHESKVTWEIPTCTQDSLVCVLPRDKVMLPVAGPTWEDITHLPPQAPWPRAAPAKCSDGKRRKLRAKVAGLCFHCLLPMSEFPAQNKGD